ncbi:MAG: radical SAM protein [Elusimicrobiota bacterium]|jgi:cyclic pyranopterin phosphate synthase
MNTRRPRIERLAVELHYDCPQRCVFCSEGPNIERFRGQPLPERDIVRVMVAMRRQGTRTMFFAGGGEPTLHPRFLGLLKAAKDLGYRTFVVTNGGPLGDPGFAARALPLLDEVCVSVNGHTPRLHDGLTRTPGSFARLLRAFEHLRASPGTLFKTNTVVTRRSWESLADIVAFLSGQGSRVCRLAQLAPEGRGSRRYRERAVPHGLWRRKAPLLERTARAGGAGILFDGLPMCALGPLRSLSADFEKIPTVWVRRSSKHLGLQIEEERLDETRFRFKAPACGRCADTEVCCGVFHHYAETFGTADLQPRPNGVRS